MSEAAEKLLNRIDALLDGRTRYWLSKEITDGASTRVFTDVKRTGSVPKEARLNRIAEVLGTTTDYLMGRSGNPAAITSEVLFSDKHMDWRGPERGEPGIPLMGTGDCAEVKLEDEAGRKVSVERASFDNDFPVRMIARPPALRGARDIYAIHFVGESMMPRFEPGEIGIVDPHRHPAAGNYVVVQLTNGEEDAVTSVLVKRLVRQSSQELVLEQFNPPLTFIVPRRQVARVHRILQQTDLLLG